MLRSQLDDSSKGSSGTGGKQVILEIELVGVGAFVPDGQAGKASIGNNQVGASSH